MVILIGFAQRLVVELDVGAANSLEIAWKEKWSYLGYSGFQAGRKCAVSSDLTMKEEADARTWAGCFLSRDGPQRAEEFEENVVPRETKTVELSRGERDVKCWERGSVS